MALLDWLIVALFFAGLIGAGFWLSSKTDDSDDFFLSHRNMPWWAASASVAATALSAGTFVGVPQVTYTGNLTWMLLLVGSTIGGVIAALCIVPVLYRCRHHDYLRLPATTFRTAGRERCLLVLCGRYAVGCRCTSFHSIHSGFHDSFRIN